MLKKYYSEVLTQNYSINETTGEFLFDDGVKYTRDEVSTISGIPAIGIKTIHHIKRLFYGTVI